MLNKDFFDELAQWLKPRQILTSPGRTRWYRTGIRVGGGAACAVVLPHSLGQLWRVLKVCVSHDKIIIMQAANTGLTAGSTPDGNDYDRDVVIVNTLALDDLVLINGGRQVIAFAGATLFQLEDRLRPLKRSPHSVIGSSCIGASVVGGVCNNSGGNLVNRGPAYTELALFVQLTADGELELVNHLGIALGDNAEQIIANLEQRNFDPDAVGPAPGAASDNEYRQRVRAIDADTPARFNADKRRLYEASGCAGKLAVFAVRLDTFPEPGQEQVFYVGTNDPAELTLLRRRILGEFRELPEMGEYVHRSFFDAADRYGKDTFLIIKLLGSAFLPRLYAFKSRVDGALGKAPFLPDHFTDRCLQFLARLWPDHLPPRLRAFRDAYEHHLIIKANDGAIEATRQLLEHYSGQPGSGAWFECGKEEGEAALLHRFVAGGAATRYAIVHADEVEGLLPLDIALPRNTEDWYALLPDDVLDQLAAPFRLSHFLCMVFHWDLVVKKGVDMARLKSRVLAVLDARGAKYPAEHNVGHLYQAEPDLRHFYRTLDPTNSFNAGVGKMSKRRDYR